MSLASANEHLSLPPAALPGASSDVVVETFATREAWLAARRGTGDAMPIGASEAAGALGVHPSITPWALWSEKVEGVRRNLKASASVLQRGHRWEPAVLAEYEDESGARVLSPGECVGRPGQLVIVHNRARPWLRESPDAFAIDRFGALGQVEAKTAMQANVWAPEPGLVIDRWDDAHAELVPAHYAVQGYVQLSVTHLPWVDLCALVPTGAWLGVRFVRLMRDPETQEALVDALASWRERHLLGGEPPPIDGSEACNRYLARRFPQHNTRPTRVATDEEIAKMRELAAVRAVSKSAEARAKALSNELIASADGHRLTFPAGSPDGGAYGQPQANKGRTGIDLEALRAKHPLIATEFATTGQPFVTFNLYRLKGES